MVKLSYSLHEYLCKIKNMHLFNNNENDDWGFFIDIETKTDFRKICEPKKCYHFKPSFKNKIQSHKSVSNLDQLTSNYDAIFKMDEDYEEENEKQYTKNTQNPNHKELSLIGNICVLSSIVLFLFLI